MTNPCRNDQSCAYTVLHDVPSINTRTLYAVALNSIARKGVQRVENPLAGSRGSAPWVPQSTRGHSMKVRSTQSRERVKGGTPLRSPEGASGASLENLQIPLAKRGKCGYNEWECARMGTAQDKPWKASRGGCEPGQDCLMTNHPGARFSEATRAERAERVGKDGFSRYRESRCVRLHRADRHRACQVGWYRG